MAARKRVCTGSVGQQFPPSNGASTNKQQQSDENAGGKKTNVNDRNASGP